jgi:hypothetical protein
MEFVRRKLGGAEVGIGIVAYGHRRSHHITVGKTVRVDPEVVFTGKEHFG